MKRAKWVFSLFLVLPLLLSLAGCDSAPWESGMVLSLKVTAPKDGATVTASPVTVSGRVVGTQSSGAKVMVNNADVQVKEGKFSATVPLKEGANAIVVVASGGGASPSETVRVTYVSAK